MHLVKSQLLMKQYYDIDSCIYLINFACIQTNVICVLNDGVVWFLVNHKTCLCVHWLTDAVDLNIRGSRLYLTKLIVPARVLLLGL